MPIAARIDEPSNPIDGLTLASVDLVLDASAAISSWHWISGGASLSLNTWSSIGTSEFMTLDPVQLELTDDLFHFYLTQIEASATLSMDVVQNFTEQLLPWEVEETLDPGDAIARLNSLEQELALSTTNPSFYKEFSYNGEILEGYTIYTNASMTTELFDVAFTYTDGKLTEKVITRASDDQVLTVTYGYIGEQLTTQSRSIS